MKFPNVLTTVLFVSLPVAAQIPVGTILPLRLNSSIDSHKSKPGNRITARLMQDVPLPDHQKLPAGARLVGEIVAVHPDRVSWKFDRVVVHKNSFPLRANLRALASLMEIHEAQLPTNDGGGDRGSSELDWNTVQVGGDIVYGHRGGVVMRGDQVVGHSLFGDGVLLVPLAERGSPCHGPVNTQAPQAFWLFSASACGVYGYPDVSLAHAGRSEPVGIITVAGHGRIKIGSGSGLLLRVVQ